MEEVLYLEPDEEITSVIDKIRQSKTNQINIVIPRQATLLQSVVNLKLLMKEAAGLNKTIAIITADKIGRNLAAKVGLTVFDSIRRDHQIYEPAEPMPSNEEIIEINDNQNLQEENPKGVQVHHFQENKNLSKENHQEFSESKNAWPKQEVQKFSKSDKPKIKKEINLSKYNKFFKIFGGIFGAAVLVGLFFYFPKTNIQIKVQADPFSKNQEMTISSVEAASNPDTFTFAGDLLDFNAEKEGKFPATGKKNLGGKASGTITIYNNLDSSSHMLASGTKFSSSSKTFLLKNQVVVPGATVSNLKIVPGTVDATVEAEQAGDDFNVKAGRFTIVGLPANQQEALYGQSSKDMTGGFTKEVQVVSQDDYNKAKESLLKDLSEDLKKNLASKTNNLEVLEQAVQNDITEETPSVKVDNEATEFNLKIVERERAMVFVRANFNQFVLEAMGKQIPDGKMLTLGPDDLISPQIKTKDYDNNLLKLEVSVSAKISAKVDTTQVKSDILGKSRKRTENYLNSLPGISGFDINYAPSWWPLKKVSKLSQNLNVKLEYIDSSKEGQ